MPSNERTKLINEVGLNKQVSVPNEDVDDGPVLDTHIIPIYLNDTLEFLEARVHKAEHILLVNMLNSFQSTTIR